MFEHEYLDLIPPYALGALSGTEKEKLELHLHQGCDLCEAELGKFNDTVSVLPYGLSRVPLPPALKEKTRSRLEREIGSRGKVIRWKRVWAVAAAVAIFVLGATVFQQSRRLNERDSEIASMQKQLSAQGKEIAWLRDPSVQLALLSGLEGASLARAKIVWNPDASRGIFYVNWLPPLAAGKSYQLWVIGNRGPVSAAVFEPASNGTAVVTVSQISYKGGALQFAVTIEPQGGVPQPTGKMVLAGKPL